MTTELPRSPKEAKASGSSRYFTGKPCKNGNVALRRTSNASCLCPACEAEHRQRLDTWRALYPEKAAAVRRATELKNKAKRNAYSREYNRRNREKLYAYAKQYNAANKAHVNAKSREWRLANKERHKELVRNWYAKNPEWATIKEGKRRAAKLAAMPPWMTEEHFADISAAYQKAKELTAETGVAHHVDHIIPLRHARVCGLHVPWNLRVITASENCAKGNRFDESWVFA